MRTIDADALEVVTAKVPKGTDAKSYMAGMEYVLSQIDALPTIEERKTGKWVLCNEQREEDTDNGNYRYLCSNCNYADIHAKTVKVPFCWHCGAMMEGKQP